MLEKIKYPYLNRLVANKLKLLSVDDYEYIKKVQIWKFNHQWDYVYNNLKFYSRLKTKYNLPDKISNLSDIKNFPRIDKGYINDNFEIICQDLGKTNFTLTGGTSGQVTKFPTSYINQEHNYINSIVCKKLHKGKINDKILYIWGHSHKLGNNFLKKNLNILKNKFKDFFHHRKRLNAYDLSEKNLNKIFNEIKKNQYEVIFSYASTFDILANYLKSKNYVYTKNIKIIFTSENLNEITYKKLKEIFPYSKIIGEFGMAETGIIAYSFNDYKKYKVIWTDFILQCHTNELAITEIANKVFPLINYFPDDYIKDDLSSEITIIELPEIIGKVRPNIELQYDDGLKEFYSTIYFDHILKNLDSVFSAQYFTNSKKLMILYTGIIQEKDLLNYVSKKLKKGIQNIFFKKISKPIKTISGKFKYILDEKDISNL